MERVITTNCLVFKDGKLLLGKKKRGFAEGKWNGFGGKVTEGETLEQTAKRELLEECGITATEMEHVATMDFTYTGKDKVYEVNVFKVTAFDGDVLESEEMLPQWFELHEIPFDSMWPDDAHWFPLFFANKKFKGSFIYDGYDTILEHSLEEVT